MEAQCKADWKGLFSKKFGYSQKRHIVSQSQLGNQLIGSNTLQNIQRKHYPEKSRSTFLDDRFQKYGRRHCTQKSASNIFNMPLATRQKDRVFFSKNSIIQRPKKPGMSKIKQIAFGQKSTGIYRNIHKYQQLVQAKKKISMIR